MKEEQIIKDFTLWSDPETQELFFKLCEEYKINPTTISDLINILKETLPKDRARGIYDDIENCLLKGDN